MTDKGIILKGITWNHSRGLIPMVATAQRFSELHLGVEITWEKRSLQEFADFSIEQLADRFDLLVIDHPWAGFAAKTRTILPLDQYLPESFIADQKINSVGQSFESYTYNGHQWAMAIDAATPVASSRPDILEKSGLTLPGNFGELLQLASRGLVAFAGIPIDVLMAFYMFCSSLGEDPCQKEDVVVSEAIGIEALKMFGELARNVASAFFSYNPIKVYEAMTLTDEIAYCPFAYGYSNYSRRGYARKLLHFHDLIKIDGQTNARSTLGGTGLAVSARCRHIPEVMEYVAFVASADCQQTLFFSNGGQPGHLQAWKDETVNSQCENYFKATLPALQRAFLRPRYDGSMDFQDHAGEPVRDYLINGGSEQKLLAKLNELYNRSRSKK